MFNMIFLGYINGVEELDSALDMIAGDSTRTKFKLRKMSEKSKSQVVRDLGLLQRSYPGIATAVKTKSKTSFKYFAIE